MAAEQKQDTFVERPNENEREKALNYIANLIDKASNNSVKNEDDIRELLKIQKLLNGKRYGLVWEEHEEKVDEEMKTKIPVFKEDKKRMITGIPNDPHYNFLLVGDNLHSLHLLEKTHRGKVNVICIDPPYNTQNKDFKYNDKFVDPSDEYTHSKWISFMYRRLKQAKQLLTYDGVILINIDNNEYANLKLLMDQIFPGGYVTTLHVEMSTVQGMKVRSAKQGNIVKNGEFVLIYTKDGHNNIMKHTLYDYRGYDNHYSKYITKDNQLASLKDIFKKKYPDEHLKSLDKMFRSNDNFKDFIAKNLDRICADDKISGFNTTDYPVGKVYTVQKNGRKYHIYNNGRKIRQLLLLKNSWGKCDDFRETEGLRKIRGDWWPGFYLDMGNVNKEGGVKLSNGKKPLRLIKQLLKATTDKDDLILDFFAGSGTTGQAVLDLNREDNGQRKFILCTNNEAKIAEKITYQRMLNVNSGYKNYDANPLNLKYYTTKFVDKESINLEEELLKNVKTLIELQYGINFEDSSFAMVTTRKAVSKLKLKNITKVFMRSRVHRMMAPNEQERYFNSGIEIVDIPENFFGKELQGWI